VLDPDLTALADAHGVATRYSDVRSRLVEVPAATLRAVLAAMDVPAADPEQVRGALAVAAARRRLVEPTVVAGQGGTVRLTVPDAQVTVTTADGGTLALGPDLRLPPDLAFGAHRLTVSAGDDEQQAHLLVVPPRCPVPDGLRTWGWQVQLYALRSRASWGIGDLGDLRDLVDTAATLHGAGLVLLNPLHAVLPVLPQEPSPYYPASRRFTNPLYLRVEHCDGYQTLPPQERDQVDALAAEARAANLSRRIDRDAAFRLKMSAFQVLAAHPLPPDRLAAFAAYREAEGQGLVDFATACALAERHGRSFHDWPMALRDPRSEAVAAARAELAQRVGLHEWLQWQCDEQLAAAAAAARDTGMPVGLVADLAVGVDPGGADAWALQADLAQGVTVGAPPDAFSPLGQDWQLPPLRPDRLAATGHAAFRDLLRSLLRRAGGLRIDHVLGCFRLFWIPEGADPSQGTYVRYPADDLLGVLALEAQAAGALIIGEDLGNVEPGVRERLRTAGVLGSRVLWFERGQDGRRLGSEGYPERALTSITTHDLPTAAGLLADEPTRVRAALGRLEGNEATERDRAAAERRELLELLVGEGLLGNADAPPDAVVEALHAFVARTPSMLVTAGLNDAVGDLSQPNLPGTVDEYPNWRLPIADGDGRPMLLDDLLASPKVAALAATLRRGRGHTG
jgi:4-alpha-glucanotransferase